MNRSGQEQRLVPTSTCSHCGGACIFKVDTEGGVAREGFADVLAKDEHSPGGAYFVNMTLVQVTTI